MLSDDAEQEKLDGEVKKSPSLQRLQMLHDLEAGGLVSLSNDDDNTGVVSRCRSSSSAGSAVINHTDDVSNEDYNAAFQNMSTDEKVCDHEDCRKFIFVRSVPHSMSKQEFLTFFSQFGTVCSARIMLNHRTKKSKGTGRVEYNSIAEAVSVLRLPREKLIVGEKTLRPIPNRCQRLWRYEKTSNPQQQNRNKTKLPSAVVSAMAAANVDVEMKENEKPDPDCCINLLPSELLNYILSFLDLKERIRVEVVCKNWRRLNTTVPWVDMHELNFRNHFFKLGCPPLNSRILYEVLRRCGATLRRIDFSYCSQQLSHNFPVVISNMCPNLEEINFQCMPITNKSLRILSEDCKNLKKVYLERCDSIGEKGVWWLLKNCRLQELSLSKNNRVTGLNFRFLTEEIKSLNLNGCTKVSPAGLKLLCKCQNITDLRLDNCRSVNSPTLIKVLECIGSKLTQLHLGGVNENVSTETYVESLIHCKQLQHLNLENNSWIVDSVVEVISQNCLEIRILNVNGTYFTDVGLFSLCNLPRLRNLHCSYNCKISDVGIDKLSEKGLLEHLEMRGCAEISDAGCCQVASNCGRLKLLDVSSCPNVSDETVTAIMQMVRLEAQKVQIIVGGTCVKLFVDNDSIQVIDVNFCPPSLHPWQFGMQLYDDVYVDGPLLDVQDLVDEHMILEEMMDEALAYEPHWYYDDDDDDNQSVSDDLDMYDEELEEFM